MTVKTRIVIPVYEGFDLLDVCGPSEMFGWANGYEVELMAEVPGPVRANNGFTIHVAADLPSQIEPCDALWIPGGAPDQLNRILTDPKQTYLSFISQQAAQATWVCSVCEGALLLCGARLLDGFEMTTHWRFIPYVLQHFPAVKVVDGYPRYVSSGNRLTGGGISSGLDESLKLIELLSGTAAAQSVQQTTQYYPDPPVSSAIPHALTSPMP